MSELLNAGMNTEAIQTTKLKRDQDRIDCSIKFTISESAMWGEKVHKSGQFYTEMMET